jgi:hypothetical protein
MKSKRPQKPFRLTLGRSMEAVRLPAKGARQLAPMRPARVSHSAREAFRALKATAGAKEILAKSPGLNSPNGWTQIAFFSVCLKTGTATYLDIWDADHFDLFTDMQRELTACHVWFSDQGFAYWNSPQTHTGRINCYFRAPADGNYICNVQLQSYGGPATVDCQIDGYDFGPLWFNGPITQPHPSYLSAGYHSFKINQISGAYFFIGNTVWQT